jgi:dCMP deaminase
MSGDPIDFYYNLNNFKKEDPLSIIKWDLWFLGLAKYISTASKDPSTKTGAVIVDWNRRIISTGYNGFPQGIDDKKEDYENRELKYKKIIHCEMNAILFAKQSLFDCTLYTYPFLSCSRCACHVIQTGIKRVVGPSVPNHLKERWNEDITLSKSMFKEANIEVMEYNHEDLIVHSIRSKVDVEDN